MPASHRTYNILVVEDNPGDAHLIAEAFRECGHACHLKFAESLIQAKELLHSERFELILSDMGVPNGDGEEFIKSIRADEELRSIPVIVLSGSSNPGAAYEAGANAFISKTMDMDQFFSKISALMHFWVDVAVLPEPGLLRY